MLDENLWLKTEDVTIDICLNCTELFCEGECEKVRPIKEAKKYIIKRQEPTSQGLKISYAYYREGAIKTRSNVLKARQFCTKAEAQKVINTIAESIRDQYSVVERENELNERR